MTDTIRYRWRFADQSGNDITDYDMDPEQVAYSATAWSGNDYVIALKRNRTGAKWQVDSVGHPVSLRFHDQRFDLADHSITALQDLGGAIYEEGDEL